MPLLYEVDPETTYSFRTNLFTGKRLSDFVIFLAIKMMYIGYQIFIFYVWVSQGVLLGGSVGQDRTNIPHNILRSGK
jgi:hypothetical protein